MTQSQVATYLADKVGINKKQAKSAIEELTALVVRELKKEGALRLAGLGLLAGAGVLAIALPFLYANFDLYNTYHRANGPLAWDLMPVIHPVLEHMFHLA